MGRSESKAAFKQSSAQSAQDQANAQNALGATNKAVSDYEGALKNFLRFGRSTYGANGEFLRDQNTLATTTAKAGADQVGGNLALNAMRTGENTAGYAATDAEARRAASRDLTTQLAGADADRLAKLTAINQYGVEAEKLPAAIQESLYGTSVSGATGQGANMTNAARMPGFWDTFAPALAQGAGTAAAGACPCEGSLIRMADGTDKPAEQIRKGEFVWPLSTSAPPNPVLETPQPIKAHCFAITTKAGRKHAGSDTHTVALAIGGYAFIPEALQKIVLAESVTDEVISVEDIGERTVYPMKLGGSHTYMADGIWILS